MPELGSEKRLSEAPLKVVLESAKNKTELLKNSKKLRGMGDKYKNVYINPDLTPNERKADKELVKRLKTAREKHPIEIVKISKGKS